MIGDRSEETQTFKASSYIGHVTSVSKPLAEEHTHVAMTTQINFSFRSNISSLEAEHTFVHCSQSSSAVTYIDVFTDSAVEAYYTLFVDELDLFNLR